jgi:glycosyltransferase involved in cell wall biosynthesis
VALAAALADDLREPWDAVHLHHVEAPLLGPAVRGPVRVHHLHTCLAEELPTYAGMGLAGAAVGALLDRACARGADLTVALSERGAALARGWGAGRAIVIRPGVEPAPDLAADEARRALGIAGDRWIAYTGNLDGYQDLERLLRAAALADLQLLVATGARLDPLRAAARRAGLPERRLKVVQTRDHAAVQRVLAASVAAVVPRARCAGFPMKALNALAAGRPLVALRGALDPMPGVVLVDRPTPEALAAALAALLADPARAAALGSRGRAALPRWADAAAAHRAPGLCARSGARL